MRRSLSAVVLCLTLWTATGCGTFKGMAADSVERALAKQPGVAYVWHSFISDMVSNIKDVDYSIWLDDDATPQDAAALAATYVRLMAEKDFSAFSAGLIILYKDVVITAPGAGDTRLDSLAAFDFPAKMDWAGLGAWLSDYVRDWLAVAQSPGIQSARVWQDVPKSVGGNYKSTPTFDPGAFRGAEIVVGQAPSDSALRTLAQTYPFAEKAEWIVLGGPLSVTTKWSDYQWQQDPSADLAYSRTYSSWGVVPSQAVRDLWPRIVAGLDRYDTIIAATNNPDDHYRDAAAPTAITIDLPPDTAAQWGDQWIPTFAAFPGPVQVKLNGSIFLLGGCSRLRHGDRPAERELKRRYERC